MAPRPVHRPLTAIEEAALREAERQLGDVLLYRVTENGLGKDNIYVRKRNFARLATMGLHDYAADIDGTNSTTLPILLLSADGATIVSEIRWYTVENDRNDARFRISDLGSILDPHDLLALGMSDGIVVARNLSRRGTLTASDLPEQAELVPLEATEGRLVERLHRARERDRSIVRARKDAARQEHGALACEACGIAPGSLFGSRAERVIEAHHLKPLADLPKDGGRTLAEDLALLCATCHRLLHALDVTVDELRRLRAAERSP